MRALGQLQHGTYADAWESTDERELQNELSVDTPANAPLHEGAAGSTLETDSDDSYEGSSDGEFESKSDLDGGLPSDSSDTGSLDIPLSIRERVEREVCHRPIKALRVGSPPDQDVQVRLFEQIDRWTTRGYVPAGYGVLPSGHNYRPYRPIAEIQVERRKDRFEQVTLPEEVWLPRTMLWLRAVVALTALETAA